jgi:Fic family protein
MKLDLKIIPSELLEPYKKSIDPSLKKDFDALSDSELSIDSFSFYTSVSAVFSSKIEGEHIELDSYIKHKRFGIEYQPDYTRKIDDLYEAYLFAQKNTLNAKNIELAHSQITKHILKKPQQGKIRSGNMFVITKDGKIEYVAVTPDKVKSEMQRFYNDLDILLKTDLSFEESLFYAAMIHLVFVKIHPFDDGNGRTARLIEKWFIAQKQGNNAWFVQSERNYYDNHQTYYNNIRRIGLDYIELNYKEALPFLQMLPNCLNYDSK